MTRAEPPPLGRAWSAVTIACTFVVPAAALVLLFAAGPRTFAWVFLAFLAACSASSITVAAVSYRRTMRRPWPEVAPLSDDDWDD